VSDSWLVSVCQFRWKVLNLSQLQTWRGAVVDWYIYTLFWAVYTLFARLFYADWFSWSLRFFAKSLLQCWLQRGKENYAKGFVQPFNCISCGRFMLTVDGVSERTLMELAVLNTTYGQIARHVIWGSPAPRDITEWILTGLYDINWRSLSTTTHACTAKEACRRERLRRFEICRFPNVFNVFCTT